MKTENKLYGIERTFYLVNINKVTLTEWQNAYGLFSLRINDVCRFLYSICISNWTQAAALLALQLYSTLEAFLMKSIPYFFTYFPPPHNNGNKKPFYSEWFRGNLFK